jgi:adenine/guanine phosphoribosyltransferase-like PRPP-binding protein
MEFWQSFAPATPDPPEWCDAYAAPMPDGTRLALPLRDLGDSAIAGLILTQAAFPVVDQLAAWLAERVTPFAADIVVGLPTLGHVVGAALARALGHSNWVAAGFSRKFWYDEALSVPVASVTSPTAGRRMWLDPRMLPRLHGRRVLLADDVMSTGASMQGGVALLRAAGIVPVAVGVVMIQGNRWQAAWDASPVVGAFATPLFRRGPAGWIARPETAPHQFCSRPG